MLLKLRYIRNVFDKLSTFAIFGISSILLALILFPILHIISGFSTKRFQKITRNVIHYFFKILIWYTSIIGGAKYIVKNKELLQNVRGKVIVANHPSLLDVVILISLIKNANCIYKGSLTSNKFISAIVSNLYISNEISFDKQMELAKESLKNGDNLIVFPEGTRSTPGAQWLFKKGAARLAIYANADVLPIYFGGNEKIGLRKGDSIFAFNPTECYIYKINALDAIPVKNFAAMPMSNGAALLTQKIASVLNGAKNEANK